MKKNFLILASLVAIATACSKSSSGEDNQNPTPKKQEENTFSAEIKDAFSSQGNANKDINNILVNDFIPYEINITDSNSNGKEANYSLFISEEGIKKHQILNRDYELYYENENKEKVQGRE
jgi:hypothetical protein